MVQRWMNGTRFPSLPRDLGTAHDCHAAMDAGALELLGGAVLAFLNVVEPGSNGGVNATSCPSSPRDFSKSRDCHAARDAGALELLGGAVLAFLNVVGDGSYVGASATCCPSLPRDFSSSRDCHAARDAGALGLLGGAVLAFFKGSTGVGHGRMCSQRTISVGMLMPSSGSLNRMPQSSSSRLTVASWGAVRRPRFSGPTMATR